LFHILCCRVCCMFLCCSAKRVCEPYCHRAQHPCAHVTEALLQMSLESVCCFKYCGAELMVCVIVSMQLRCCSSLPILLNLVVCCMSFGTMVTNSRVAPMGVYKSDCHCAQSCGDLANCDQSLSPNWNIFFVGDFIYSVVELTC